jgi:hypothetical protein
MSLNQKKKFPENFWNIYDYMNLQENIHRIKEVMGLNEGYRPDWSLRTEIENRLQKESNLNIEVIRYYYDKYLHLIDGVTEDTFKNISWDEMKSVVDSHNDRLLNTGNDEENFINAFNHVSENYNKFECAYIWDDEEEDIQDSLTIVANLAMKNPSLMSSVPKNKLYNDLKYMVKVLYGKESIILYRVLFVKSLDHINYDNLGTHWTWTHKAYHKDVIQYLYDSAEHNNDEYEITPNDLYIVKVLSPTSNISYPATLWAIICYGSSEHEVTLFQTQNIKVLKSKHFKIPPSWGIE